MLDLATGTGAVARLAAGHGADVVGVDSSPGMLALGRELSPGIEFVVAGAAALPFDDDSFEAVTCGLSLSHFEARGTVFDEVRRVLRPGGCFAASTWGRGGDSAARQVGTLFNRYAPNPPAWLDEDTWSDPVEGRAALRDAGFDDVTVLTEAFAGRFADAEEVLAWSLAWPLRAERLAALDHAARERFLAEARELLSECDLAWRFAFNFYLGWRH